MEKKPVNLKKKLFVTLYFPTKELLKRFSKRFKDAKLPFETNELSRSVTFPKSQEGVVKKVFRAMKKEFKIKIEDLE